jgi:hypothetical protein
MRNRKVIDGVVHVEFKNRTALIDQQDEHLLDRAVMVRRGYILVLDKNDKKKRTLIHRIITNAPDGMEVDHINHNTSDNRRSNLRICTKSQNVVNKLHRPSNRNPYKGVSLFRGKKKESWASSFRTPSGERIRAGTFDSPEEAAIEYNWLAMIHHGEFSSLNVIPENAESPIYSDLLLVRNVQKKTSKEETGRRKGHAVSEETKEKLRRWHADNPLSESEISKIRDRSRLWHIENNRKKFSTPVDKVYTKGP